MYSDSYDNLMRCSELMAYVNYMIPTPSIMNSDLLKMAALHFRSDMINPANWKKATYRKSYAWIMSLPKNHRVMVNGDYIGDLDDYFNRVVIEYDRAYLDNADTLAAAGWYKSDNCVSGVWHRYEKQGDHAFYTMQINGLISNHITEKMCPYYVTSPKPLFLCGELDVISEEELLDSYDVPALGLQNPPRVPTVPNKVRVNGDIEILIKYPS